MEDVWVSGPKYLLVIPTRKRTRKTGGGIIAWLCFVRTGKAFKERACCCASI